MATILVVDDEQAIRSTLKRFLEQEGHDVVLASDGLEALAILNDATIDVAFVDIVMPTVDGLTLTRHMLQDHSYVRVIMMSGYDDVIDLAARELGLVLQLLKKPFTLEDVKAVLG
jgi:CheY-like chemotaxis protein